MKDCIIKEIAIERLKRAKPPIVASEYGAGYVQGLKEAIEILKRTPVADVQPVVDTENMATVSDEFICKKCGIYLKDYIKIVMDEDNEGYIDELHYEYEPKFCPECGAKVKEGEKT